MLWNQELSLYPQCIELCAGTSVYACSTFLGQRARKSQQGNSCIATFSAHRHINKLFAKALTATDLTVIALQPPLL